MHTARMAVLFLSVIFLSDRAASAQPTFSRIDTALTLPLSGGMTVGDFDRDGVPDLVLETHSTAEPLGLVFLRGHGDGTFAPPVQVFSGCCANAASGDLNGDGNLDLVFGAGAEAWALLGNGDGTFGRLQRSPAPASPRPPLVRDFNGDGRLDLALADQNGGVSVLLGDGDGTFAAARNFPIGGGAVANGLAAGDFNGDGVLDVAASNPGPPDFTGTTVSVLLGHGDGTFGAPTDFTVGTTPFRIVTADFDGNGTLDLAVGNYMSASVSVLLGRGDGTFAPGIDAPDGQFPVGLGAADFNDDGKPDLAVGSGETSLSVLLGQGHGTMGPATSVPAVTSAENLAVADFNLDGRPDVLVVYAPPANAFSVFLNTTTADTTPPVVTAAATPSTLWPPSGRTILVTISGRITDTGAGVDPSSATFRVTDEYGIVHPSGPVAVAADGRYRVHVPLTASRAGADRDGRTYTITVSAADKAGNVGVGTTHVRVPHDRGHATER